MKEYKRNCPKCNRELTYSSIQSFCVAKKRNTWCYSCRKQEVNSRPDFKKKIEKLSEDFKIRFAGEKNPFYGKCHSEKTKELIKKKTPKKVGKDNPCYNKSIYDWWVETYGKNIADEKMIAYKKKISIKTSGKNNPMYGKPSPQGSGNGWSGWYKGWYFRSLHELSFMVKYIERFRMKWESGEQRKYLIPYTDWQGNQKNYFADFIINGKYLVECKPKKLHNSVLVNTKTKGALGYCERHGMKYKLISPILLTDDEIFELYEKKEIEFIERYKKQVQKYFSRQPNRRPGHR